MCVGACSRYLHTHHSRDTQPPPQPHIQQPSPLASPPAAARSPSPTNMPLCWRVRNLQASPTEGRGKARGTRTHNTHSLTPHTRVHLGIPERIQYYLLRTEHAQQAFHNHTCTHSPVNEARLTAPPPWATWSTARSARMQESTSVSVHRRCCAASTQPCNRPRPWDVDTQRERVARTQRTLSVAQGDGSSRWNRQQPSVGECTHREQDRQHDCVACCGAVVQKKKGGHAGTREHGYCRAHRRRRPGWART
jgi:hypothetical protein